MNNLKNINFNNYLLFVWVLFLLIFFNSKGFSNERKVQRYGETVVKEVYVLDLLRQVSRSYFYLEEENGVDFYKKYNSWSEQMKNVQKALQINEAGDWLHIDYDNINSILVKVEGEVNKEIRNIKKDLAVKYPWYKLRDYYTEKASGIGKIQFALRINDFYQRNPDLIEENSYYAGSGNWSAFKPLKFGLINSHPWLFDGGGVDDGGGGVKAGIYNLEKVNGVILKNKSEGYPTLVDVLIPGSPRMDPLPLWDREEWEDWSDMLSSIGTMCKGNPHTPFSVLINEPEMHFSEDALPYIKREFQSYLKKKYSTISGLNDRLQTEYSSFEDIDLPEYTIGGRRISTLQFASKNSGLIYELQKCRQQQFLDYVSLMISSLKKSDPNHRVIAQMRFMSFLDIFNIGYSPFDYSSLPWYSQGTHHFNSIMPFTAQCYGHSFAYYSHHPRWATQFSGPWWNGIWGVRTYDELIERTVLENNFWTDIAWSIKGFNVYVLDETWGKWGNNLRYINPSNNWNTGVAICPLGDTPVRYCTGVIPLVKEKVNRIADIIKDFEMVHQKIAIMVPSSTILISDKKNICDRWIVEMSEWLIAHQLVPIYVPEEYIANGKENLEDVEVLIVPYAPFILEGADKNIKEWVKKGGTLVAVGSMSVTNPYGDLLQGVLHNAFGIEKFYQRGETWMMNNEEKIVKESSLGRGRVLYLPQSMKEKWQAEIRKIIEPLRMIYCDSYIRTVHTKERRTDEDVEKIFNDIHILLYENPETEERYLWVLNFNIKEKVKPQIKIKGNYTRIVDMMIEGGVPVNAQKENGWTFFETQVHPGGGILFQIR